MTNLTRSEAILLDFASLYAFVRSNEECDGVTSGWYGVVSSQKRSDLFNVGSNFIAVNANTSIHYLRKNKS